MDTFLIIEIIGAIIGLTYIYLEYKASFWLWTAGILMSLFYTAVYAHAEFYAYMATNIYYIGANAYGLWMWKRSEQQQGDDVSDPIKPMPQKQILPVLGIYIVINVIVYFLLSLTDSTVVLQDTFLTSLSVVPMWMMAKKYYHQWLLWIVVNIASVFIFFYTNLIPTAILYIVYSVVSIMGFFNWRKMSKSTACN
ncbi:nicotinamide riboside transporter PnuC [Bacteroidales bacterium OttesenSCG-928-B11]|nr:nicotinamide riboside transporter PnuC [Bacteroidales bacterium OttesenSCG-928-E04]MDL2308185.1 nicotinamide riboside transporter PnuC [Bacteroidales bacterium OttesenSCG-928-C03]MDL2312979.1 nicotinamide riboside transporter PnuC [Bacteroidales bacterium OttesenSCG-928-B11]MDL2325624.1 nicotinamide riboside transporter PnuC [Bacteroidales bacterium OttesenSCG-928-A14]